MRAYPSGMLPLELTLVLAATRDMGIGRNGTLPWTGLKKEMAYFARVTKRPPSHVKCLPFLLLFPCSFAPPAPLFFIFNICCCLYSWKLV